MSPARPAIRVDDHRLELFGLCPACQAVEGREPDDRSPRSSSRPAAFLSAFLGGLVALRAVSHVGIIIAIGAGIRIGAAFFDLIPEAVELLGGSLDQVDARDGDRLPGVLRDREADAVHVGHEAAAELDHGEAAHRHVGVIGASGMSIHSFLDGVALAAGLVVGGGLGIVIAVVVVIHRFSDGISVVSLLLASRTPSREAYRWVAIVAIAPVLGVLLGLARAPSRTRPSA